jgi:hypothetical protein
MRYDDATGHLASWNKGVLYYTPGEYAGFSVCSSRAGTGINGPDWQPEPRYGDGAPGRGNCPAQILVNDRISPPSR